MNVLELLQQYLGRPQPVSDVQMRGGGQGGGATGQTAAQRQALLSSGLPDAVIRSILGQPSYGEGQIEDRGNPAIGQEIIGNILGDAPQRDEYLFQQMLQARENQRLQRLGLPFSGQATQFDSPLNQMMSRPIAPGMNL